MSASEIRVQDIDHSGIVAGVIDEMGLVEQINQRLKQQLWRDNYIDLMTITLPTPNFQG